MLRGALSNRRQALLCRRLGDNAQTVGWIIFVLVTIFVVTAVSNGANLNDGMDGMAAGNSAIIGLTLGILAYVSSHIEYNDKSHQAIPVPVRPT